MIDLRNTFRDPNDQAIEEKPNTLWRKLKNYLINNAYRYPKVLGALVTAVVSFLSSGIVLPNHSPATLFAITVLLALTVVLTMVLVGHITANRAIKVYNRNYAIILARAQTLADQSATHKITLDRQQGSGICPEKKQFNKTGKVKTFLISALILVYGVVLGAMQTLPDGLLSLSMGEMALLILPGLAVLGVFLNYYLKAIHTFDQIHAANHQLLNICTQQKESLAYIKGRVEERNRCTTADALTANTANESTGSTAARAKDMHEIRALAGQRAGDDVQPSARPEGA